MHQCTNPVQCTKTCGIHREPVRDIFPLLSKKEAGGEALEKDAPTFLPREDDQVEAGAPDAQKMGPVGPWATGKVDWSPLAGLTGTRPVVDHYSLTRYSEAEWRKHNEEVLCASSDDLHRVNMAEFNSKRALECISAAADKAQYLNTQRLAERDHEILRWETEVENAILGMTEEIKHLVQKRLQARQAKAVLVIVSNIANECMSRRALREGFDLQKDKVEMELIKECALVREVSNLIDKTLVQIEEQLERNNAIKDRLESDWSDKFEAHQLESDGVKLRTSSTTTLFKPSATKFPADQSTPVGWENNTKEILTIAETIRIQSCQLRALLDGPVLQDCIRDLKAQGDKVDVALARSISDTQQCVKAMTTELEVVVRRNAECERIILDLQNALRGLDKAMKAAQSRLDNLQQRPRAENIRDTAQFGLVQEVKNLAEMITTLKGQLTEAEDSLLNLIKSRTILEKELQNKLKTIEIDQKRCQAVRSHYPSATAMCGH
ncbi:Tektin family [Nesidiocoris tenuis]|uniref:Tektin n=1 Tax=Nesidiocoris tenuis TaxID=355587 RepID=A0ABN7A6J8_9HEMI|nr:Tektin family [Nesidiocoris tenuis]